MGRIIALRVNEGDRVSRGDLIAEIDAREARSQQQKAQAGLDEARAALVEIDRSATAARAAIATAESQRELAEQTFARFKELYERRSASGQEFDEAKSRLKTATSEVERAKLSVEALLSKKQQINARVRQAEADIHSTRIYQDYARISAPVSGVIVRKYTEQGAVASPGVPLVAIEDSSQFRLEAAVEESKLSSIRIGERATVRIDALGGGQFFGIVSEITPSADAASRTSVVKIDLPPNDGLKSGLYGAAIFPLAARESLAVSQAALITRGQLTGVFVVAPDGTAQFRVVTTGKTADGLTEVLSGLAEGDEYVSADAQSVVEGARLK
jgi:multidrug resistance efflux pump